MHIAIIGAGLAGLTLAQQLNDMANITVFEKARGVSGRLATRSADAFQFDHGAQYFTARDARFQTFLQPYIKSGVVQEWTPKVLTLALGEKPYKRDWFEPHYVAVPSMTALAKHMAADLDIKLQTQITALTKVDHHWQLTDQHQQTHGPFDWVLCTAPAPQAYQLMPDSFAAKNQLLSVQPTPCFSLMLGFNNALKLNFDAAEVKNSAIRWICVNSHKPKRPTAFTLLIHTDAAWSSAHINDDPTDVQHYLLQTLEQLLAQALAPEHIALHRWLYAGTAIPLGQDCLIDTDQSLGVCGDGCIDGRVEAAFLSAMGLATKLMKFWNTNTIG
jgi:hypothetical protein